MAMGQGQEIAAGLIGEHVIEVDGAGLPVCMRCGHRACADCFYWGFNWCDRIAEGGNLCCGGRCAFGRAYSAIERAAIIRALPIPDFGSYVIV